MPCILQLEEKLKVKNNVDESEEDPKVRQWLLDRISQPASLRELIIYRLRRIFDHRLQNVVPVLPLPSRIKEMILLKDVLI